MGNAVSGATRLWNHCTEMEIAEEAKQAPNLILEQIDDIRDIESEKG